MISVPYYLTYNYIGDFRPLTDNKKIPYGTVDKKTAELLLADKNASFYEDLRLPALSIRPEKEADAKELVYNYSLLFSSVLANDSVIGLHLDYGLIPFAFYPTSHADYIHTVDEVLAENGLYHFKIPARYNHDVKSVRRSLYDSWVSRMDAAYYIGRDPEKLQTADLFRGVMGFDPA